MGIKLKIVINLATFNLFFNFIFYIFEILKNKLNLIKYDRRTFKITNVDS